MLVLVCVCVCVLCAVCAVCAVCALCAVCAVCVCCCVEVSLLVDLVLAACKLTRAGWNNQTQFACQAGVTTPDCQHRL